MINIQKILSGVTLLFPLFYIAMGCLLFTDFFDNLADWQRVAFGIAILLYGGFRMYKVYTTIGK